MGDWMPTVKTPVFAAMGALLVLLGGWDVPLQALFTLNLLDLGSGILKAFILGNLSSQSCGPGAARKLFMWLVLAAAVQVDNLTGQGSYARDATLTVWCVTEGISILENAAAAGLPVPTILRQALEKVREIDDLRVGGTRPPTGGSSTPLAPIGEPPTAEDARLAITAERLRQEQEE